MKCNQIGVIVFLSVLGCHEKYLMFDSDIPGKDPKIFATTLIAPNNEHVGYCAFSPDGSELYYCVTNDRWSSSKIIRISSDDLEGKDTLYLKDRNYEGEPFITRDGQAIYFTAVLPPKENEIWQADQYRARRTSKGWGVPEKLDAAVNTKASEWHISISDSNIMYFTTDREAGTSSFHGDIYRIELNNDKFINPTKLPFPINTDYNDSDPLIAPDESFLIFHSDRPGGFGQHDLYITFNVNSQWSDPVNMGKKINTAGWEMAPTLTPDGKYLLYTYRKELVTSEPARIYWVSTEILNDYK
jgi:Tol biopolymer transport system component